MRVEHVSPLGEEFVGPPPSPDVALDTLSRFAAALGITFDTLEEVEEFTREFFVHMANIKALSEPCLH